MKKERPSHCNYDLIVVGSGIAGLYAALTASAAARVCLLTKGTLSDSNTWLAQGGIAAAFSEEDSPQAHLEDTLAAGAGLCRYDAVAVMVTEGPHRVKELLAMGTPFDCEKGRPALTREGAHRKNRILHCGGDATGRLIQATLQESIQKAKNITVREHVFVTDLLVHDGVVNGVRTLSGELLFSPAVILATGGLGQVYHRTTNPAVATGDGVAMAWRAGALVADMEFIQFHPTVFQGTSEQETFLISEAVRGEGGVLRNSRGERFMEQYHPMAELGPRDVVARAILDQMKQQGGAPVYLDITHRGSAFLEERFPTICQKAKERGLKLGKDWLPVSPAAHYAMGGIATGLDGQSTLTGLFACGEAACSGVHGANRLASNSLLEGLVFAYRAVKAIERGNLTLPGKITCKQHFVRSNSKQSDVARLRAYIRKRMFDEAGVLRNGSGLTALREELANMKSHPACYYGDSGSQELNNLLTNASLIVDAALMRTESRGGHYRTDYPDTNPAYACRKPLPFEKEGITRAPIAV